MSKPSHTSGRSRSIAHNPFALRTLSLLLNAMASPAQIADRDLILRLTRRVYAVTQLRSVAPDWVCACGRRHRPYAAECELGLVLRTEDSRRLIVVNDAGTILARLAGDVVNPHARILLVDFNSYADKFMVGWRGGIRRVTATRRLQRPFPGTPLPLLVRLPTTHEWTRVARQVDECFQLDASDVTSLCEVGATLPSVGQLWRALPCRGQTLREVIEDLWESGGALLRPTDEDLCAWCRSEDPAIRNVALIALGKPVDGTW